MYAEADDATLRLFWMPKMSRWLIATVRSPDDGGGIATITARSMPDDGSTWASMLPWEARAWEMPSCPTLGMEDGDALWQAAGRRLHMEMRSPPLQLTGDRADVPESLIGLYEPKGMFHSRVYYVQRLEDISLENSVGPKCLWFAEDRGQWVLTDPTCLGNSQEVLARVNSRAWWPWEAHLGGSTSPATLGAAPFACLPVWFGGATVLAGSRMSWEVAEHSGAFHKAKDMMVSLVCAQKIMVKAAERATHPFLGTYERKGLVSSRPFYMQIVPEAGADEAEDPAEAEAALQQFVLWFSDELEQWLITEDFRFLDGATVDARASDTAWFPWEVTAKWEVSDSRGGFCQDPFLNIVAVE